MRAPTFTRYLCVLIACLAAQTLQANDLPRVHDDRLKVTLFAEHPDIVTPIALEVDKKGRVWVVESHTHFRPKGYEGPPADRIRILEDTNADGRADKYTTFFEGTTATMSLAFGPADGWVYVATRNEVFRLRDSNGDDKSDERQTIAKLDTKGNYPHNGLCGLAFHPDNGKLYFGFGENLGEDYRLVASDGKVLSGGGEGGNIYRCNPDGTDLEQIATGFWNPFGICFDAQGRMFVTDNDPDSAPPCRLLHVVRGADFGYQFRYGRGGRHPLQAWDGELPGTFGMVSGTGEAPCELLSYEGKGLPDALRGKLLVTSWGDHRIEAYELKPRGASFAAKMTPVVSGEGIRPVGIDVAPDGSIYFSDWVDRSYKLHSQGRIWRLHSTERATSDSKATPALTEPERRAATLRKSRDTTDLLRAMLDTDPYIRQAAVQGLVQSDKLQTVDWRRLAEPSQRAGVLMALRQARIVEPSSLLGAALKDPAHDVRLVAVRWIADEKLSEFEKDLQSVLADKVTSTRLLAGTLAALDRIADRKIKGRGPTIDQYLLPKLQDDKTPATVRAMALRVIPPDHAWLTLDRLRAFIEQDDPALQREAVRTLASRSDSGRFELLARVADNTSISADVRADALAGLAASPNPDIDLLMRLTTSDKPAVQAEALRSLYGVTLTDAHRTRLSDLAAQNGRLTPLIDRVLGKPFNAGRPDITDIEAWEDLLEGPGDAGAGRRVFFHAKIATCGRCHQFEGRGDAAGPDLTTIGRRITTTRLLESILQPSKEVAPYFYPWAVTLKDGTSFVGFSLRVGGGGGKHTFVDVNGKQIVVQAKDMASKTQLTTSIMPPGLHATMTDQELRDLVAFILNKR